MNLELGIALECDETGCQVQLVARDEILSTHYSELVRARIRVQPQQMVAIDRDPAKAAIVWRWVRGYVKEVNAETIGLADTQGKLGFASKVATLPLDLTIGSEIWFCSTDRALEVHDVSIAGKPAHPQRVLDYITPIIERVYADNR